MGRSPFVATYSIVACDLEAAQWGVAVQSKFLAVGSVVPWAEPHVGAIATQSYANPRYGPDGLALLREGHSAEDVISALTSADEGGPSGRWASWTVRAARRPSPVRAVTTGPEDGRETATRRRATSWFPARRSTRWR